MQLWDASGERLHDFLGYLKNAAIAFSADGRLLFASGSYGTTNVWEVASGQHLVTLFAFPDNRNGKIVDEWLAYHPDGFYHGSPGADRHLAWRRGEELLTPQTLGPQLHRPERVEAALKLAGSQ